MNEGMRRVIMVIRAIGVLFLLLGLYAASTHLGIAGLVFFGIPAVIAFVLAWIVDGFAR